MGVNNQLLVGGVCVGVVTLVVAMDRKSSERLDVVIPEDTPTDDDVFDLQRNLDAQRTEWDREAKSESLTTQACDDILRDLRMIQRRADETFRLRKPYYATDARESDFNGKLVVLLSEINQRRAQIKGDAPETEVVKDNLANPKETNNPTSVVHDSFNQGGGYGDDPGIYDSHQMIGSAFDSMIDHYAHQETSVAVGTGPSAFSQLPDGEAAKENQNEGGNKRAAEENADGLGDKVPKKHVERAQAIVQRDPLIHGSQKNALEATVIQEELRLGPAIEEEPNFDSVMDPADARQEDPPAPEFDYPEGQIQEHHDKVLEKAQALLARAEQPNFNPANDAEFGSDNFEQKLQSLRNSLLKQDDPRQIAEIQSQISTVELQLGRAATPQYTRFVEQLNINMGKINQYANQLQRDNYKSNRTESRVKKVNQYYNKLVQMSRDPTEVLVVDSRLDKLYTSTHKYAKTIYDRVNANAPGIKRQRSQADVRPKKRFKTGAEAKQADLGRHSKTGEPPTKKTVPPAPARRSSRLQGIPPESN